MLSKADDGKRAGDGKSSCYQRISNDFSPPPQGQDSREFFPESETEIQAREDLETPQLPTFSLSTAQPVAKRSHFQAGFDDDEFTTMNVHKHECLCQHEDDFKPTSVQRLPSTKSDA